jgi:hypothetical protein
MTCLFLLCTGGFDVTFPLLSVVFRSLGDMMRSDSSSPAGDQGEIDGHGSPPSIEQENSSPDRTQPRVEADGPRRTEHEMAANND